MAKTKDQKNELVESYNSLVSNSTGVLLVSYTKITPNAISDFKKKLAAVGAQYTVVKNSLFKIALKNSDLPELKTLEVGPHAAVFVSEDIATAAKALNEFIKENKDSIEVKAGILDGQELTAAQVTELSELPTMEQSIAMIAGLIDQSMVGVVNVLEDSIRSVAIIIDKAFKE